MIFIADMSPLPEDSATVGGGGDADNNMNGSARKMSGLTERLTGGLPGVKDGEEEEEDWDANDVQIEYAIHETPPLSLCLLLGFQVRFTFVLNRYLPYK